MGDGANVFNTFSFNKWADGKREEEIDKESRRRRAEQIKRLKERLRKERALREAQGDGDLDLDALIEAIQRGELINNPEEEDLESPSPDYKPTNRGIPDTLSDDYIFNEINQYAARIGDLKHQPAQVDNIQPIITLPPPDPLSWKFNRRIMDNKGETPNEPVPAKKSNEFKFNRTLSKMKN